MSYIEGLPSIYQGMVERGVFIPKTAIPEGSIFDDEIDELDAESALSAVEDLLSPQSDSACEDKLIELIDPVSGRQGADRDAKAADSLVFDDPIEQLMLRSHVFPEALPATIMYEGIEVVHEVERPLAKALEQTKYWDNQTQSDQSNTVECGTSGLSQAVQKVWAVDIYRNPHLTDVHIGISHWHQVADQSVQSLDSAKEGYHLVGYRASTNIEMSLLDEPTRDRFHTLYGTTPVGSPLDPTRGILFEGRIVSRGDGTAVYNPVFDHMPQDVTDKDQYQLLQRENAAQYLRPPSVGQPSLVSRILHPGSSRLKIG